MRIGRRNRERWSTRSMSVSIAVASSSVKGPRNVNRQSGAAISHSTLFLSLVTDLATVRPTSFRRHSRLLVYHSRPIPSRPPLRSFLSASVCLSFCSYFSRKPNFLKDLAPTTDDLQRWRNKYIEDKYIHKINRVIFFFFFFQYICCKSVQLWLMRFLERMSSLRQLFVARS